MCAGTAGEGGTTDHFRASRSEDTSRGKGDPGRVGPGFPPMPSVSRHPEHAGLWDGRGRWSGFPDRCVFEGGLWTGWAAKRAARWGRRSRAGAGEGGTSDLAAPGRVVLFPAEAELGPGGLEKRKPMSPRHTWPQRLRGRVGPPASLQRQAVNTSDSAGCAQRSSCPALGTRCHTRDQTVRLRASRSTACAQGSANFI